MAAQTRIERPGLGRLLDSIPGVTVPPLTETLRTETGRGDGARGSRP